MSKKKDLIARLIGEVEPRHPIPAETQEGRPLIEAGIVLVLLRHMTEKQAEASLAKLKSTYEDWNELRVAQVQEIGEYLKPGGKVTIDSRRKNSPAAAALKDYLQEVFQKTHGLDLEFWREDQDAAGKLVAEMPILGMAGASYLVWLASGRKVAVTPALIKLLDRLEVIKRTSSLARGRELIEPLIPPGKALEASVVLHEIAERWNDEDRPIYEEYPILRETPFGKKAHKDRQAQLARFEAQRKREEERRVREEERERKRQEQEAKRKAAAEAKRLAKEEAERKRSEAREEKKRKAAAAKAAKEAARKAAAKKREEAKKKAAAKKAAAKKNVAAKKEAERKKAAAKKAAAKKKTAKKTTARKPTTRKKATKRSTSKKSSARKTKKSTTRKSTKRKTSRGAASKASRKRKTTRRR